MSTCPWNHVDTNTLPFLRVYRCENLVNVCHESACIFVRWKWVLTACWRPVRGKMSELIPLKCCVLSLSTLYCRFYLCTRNVLCGTSLPERAGLSASIPSWSKFHFVDPDYIYCIESHKALTCLSPMFHASIASWTMLGFVFSSPNELSWESTLKLTELGCSKSKLVNIVVTLFP